MTLDVETVVAVSLMMAVFSAVAAVGTSLVLGAGFERLRAGFEVVRKQTGFFSDAIHKLEQKVEDVDRQTGQFSASIHTLEQKVTTATTQAETFGETVETLSKKVEVVDKQTAFFSDAIHKLEQRLDMVNAHEGIIREKLEQSSDAELISTAKADALVSHAEDLLMQVSSLTASLFQADVENSHAQPQTLSIPQSLAGNVVTPTPDTSGGWRFH